MSILPRWTDGRVQCICKLCDFLSALRCKRFLRSFPCCRICVPHEQGKMRLCWFGHQRARAWLWKVPRFLPHANAAPKRSETDTEQRAEVSGGSRQPASSPTHGQRTEECSVFLTNQEETGTHSNVSISNRPGGGSISDSAVLMLQPVRSLAQLALHAAKSPFDCHLS